MKRTSRRLPKLAVAAIIVVAIAISTTAVIAGYNIWNEFTLARQLAEPQGELVVNNVIIPAPEPYLVIRDENDLVELVNILGLTMVPLEPAAQALGYEVIWNESIQRYEVGGASFALGDVAVQVGDTTFELLLYPVRTDGVIFIPLTFFRDALGQTVYTFEGQVVIETYSDMF
ncbi:MAG: copper amine oxidase N-terminal domain-containing protein [Oscillospiraceae bacterium]|nr:copper amine oxidase N-terminal domain-containing protein [Oscillospiraceae bacterium]